MMTYKGNNAHDTFPSPAVFPKIAVHKFDGIVAIDAGYGSRPGFSQQQSVIGRHGITNHPTASPARTTAAKMRALRPRLSIQSIRFCPSGPGHNNPMAFRRTEDDSHSGQPHSEGAGTSSFTSATQAQARVSVKPRSARQSRVKESGTYSHPVARHPPIAPPQVVRRTAGWPRTHSQRAPARYMPQQGAVET